MPELQRHLGHCWVSGNIDEDNEKKKNFLHIQREKNSMISTDEKYVFYWSLVKLYENIHWFFWWNDKLSFLLLLLEYCPLCARCLELREVCCGCEGFSAGLWDGGQKDGKTQVLKVNLRKSNCWKKHAFSFLFIKTLIFPLFKGQVVRIYPKEIPEASDTSLD